MVPPPPDMILCLATHLTMINIDVLHRSVLVPHARARARTHTHTHTHALFTGAAKGASGTKEAARETAEEIAAKLIRGFKVRLVKSSESERQKHRQRQI